MRSSPKAKAICRRPLVLPRRFSGACRRKGRCSSSSLREGFGGSWSSSRARARRARRRSFPPDPGQKPMTRCRRFGHSRRRCARPFRPPSRALSARSSISRRAEGCISRREIRASLTPPAQRGDGSGVERGGDALARRSGQGRARPFRPSRALAMALEARTLPQRTVGEVVGGVGSCRVSFQPGCPDGRSCVSSRHKRGIPGPQLLVVRAADRS